MTAIMTPSDVPIAFGVEGSVGRIAFCEPFAATDLLVSSRPLDNSEDPSTVLDASGEMNFAKGDVVVLDALPPGTTGAAGGEQDFDSTTV
jgi:hypothetical protein